MGKDISRSFLILDGDEKSLVRKANYYGYDSCDVLMPMLPGFSGKNRTVWWFGAASLYNRLATQNDVLLYWGTKRFFDSFLREFAKWDKGAPYFWSHWDRTIEASVKRFYGSLGLYLPKHAVRELGKLPDWLGNRFLFDFIKGKLAEKSISLSFKGKPWLAPQEELNLNKGKMRITLAMIVKNEEMFLAGCLEQALPYVDDIVVVDTGSTDETENIAKSYGAKVLRHEWQDDFALARNVYMKVIPESFVMSLDADELLFSESSVLLRALAERNEQKIYYLNTYSYNSEELSVFTENANVRLFYKTNDCCYTGRIHEQILSPLPRETFLNCFILHFGYLTEVRNAKKKMERNTNLLEEATNEQSIPFDWYNLGCTLLSTGKSKESLEAFLKYFELEDARSLILRPSAYWHAARAAFDIKKIEQAMEFAEIACRSELSEAYFVRAQIHEQMGETELAIEDFLRASASTDDNAVFKVFNQLDSAIRSWVASLNAARLLEKTGKFEQAEIEYTKAHKGDNNNIIPLLGLSRVLRMQRKHQKALDWAKKGLLAAKENYDARFEYLENLLEIGNFAEVMEFADDSVKVSPLFSGIYLRVAERFHALGSLEYCNVALGQYTHYNPENLQAAIFYARCLIEDGQPKKASEVLSMDWQLDQCPETVQEVRIVKGNALYAQNDYMNALEEYALAFELNDENSELLFKIALTMLKLDRINDAFFALSRLKSIDPQYPGCEKAFEIVKLKSKLLI